MNSAARSIVSVVVLLASVVAMAVLRIVPVSRIWSQYSVLYVSASAGEGEVLSCLEQNGCSGVLTLSAQRVPFVSSITPVQPTSSEYLEARARYFTDRTGSYRLFYIPQSQEKQTSRALTELSRQGIQAGLDGSLQFPFMVPVVCLAAYILLACLSRNRVAFLVSGAPVLLCTLCVPLYPAAAAVILLLTALFLAERVWRRRGSVRAVFSCVYLDLLVAASAAIMGVLSPRALCIFALSLVASVLCLYLLHQVQSGSDRRRAFTFEPIFSAAQVPLMVSRKARVVALSAVPVAVLLVCFLLSASFLPSSGAQSVSVPTPVSDIQADDISLPDMSDYFAWAWQTITFPYRNLNTAGYGGSPSEGERITIPRYVQGDSGVQKSYETLFTFDASFRAELIDGILESDSPAIEKLLLSEGSGTRTAYRTRTRAKTAADSVSLVLMIAAMVLPLLLYVYYSVIGRRRYENGS